MPIERAKKNYQGLNGKRLNCYQSVIDAFQSLSGYDQVEIDAGAAFSGGRAPEGVCGAIYAAKVILDKAGRAQDFKTFCQRFLAQNGSLQCREIRAKKKISCLGCVEAAAAFLKQVMA